MSDEFILTDKEEKTVLANEQSFAMIFLGEWREIPRLYSVLTHFHKLNRFDFGSLFKVMYLLLI